MKLGREPATALPALRTEAGKGLQMHVNLALVRKDLQAIRQRFNALLDRPGPDACWEWTGARIRGRYGTFGVGSKTVRAHRLAYVLAYGPIPLRTDTGEDMCVLHRCDNPACCNPKHLFLGSQLDNIQDRVDKKRNGFGSKLPPIADDLVRKIRCDPRATRVVAAELGMRPTTVYYIRTRRRRAEVPD